MHVRVGLLASEGQGVGALGGHRRRDGSRDPVDNALEGEIFSLAEVTRPVLDVFSGSDQAVAEERRIAIEEYDRIGVFVDDVMAVAVSAVDHSADKALAPLPHPLHGEGVVLHRERCIGGLEVLHPKSVVVVGASCRPYALDSLGRTACRPGAAALAAVMAELWRQPSQLSICPT